MPFSSGRVVKLLRPLVVSTAGVRFRKVSSMRGEVDVVAKELAVGSVCSNGTVLEAQGLEVQGHLLLQNANLGGELVVFLGVWQQL